jgi:hypothetical protein
MQEDVEKKPKKYKTALIVIILICIQVSSLTIYIAYISDIAQRPFNGEYEFQLYIEYNGENKSNIEIDLPLPHDDKIYSELEFYYFYKGESYILVTDINPQAQYLTYSIIDSNYGKVVHVTTNDSFFICSKYYDPDNVIAPSLKLTTENKDIAYARVSTSTPTNISLILFYDVIWPVRSPSSESKIRYLSISKEPYDNFEEVVRTGYPNESIYHRIRNIFYNMEGADLTSGWNQLEIASNE